MRNERKYLGKVLALYCYELAKGEILKTVLIERTAMDRLVYPSYIKSL
jgi:hypothetical protein